jgi:BASS family bile acid:Na+ symporter
VGRVLDQFYQVALVLTLWIAGLGLGMSHRPSQILRTLRRGGLFARADLPYAIALVVVLESANAVAIPVWVTLLLPSGVQVSLGPVVRTLLLLVLAPLAVGMAIGARRPATAKRLAGWAPPLSTAGLVVVIALVLARSVGLAAEAFAAVGPAAVTAVLVALVLGWLLGGPARSTRAATSLVTGVRANGPALAIAQASFPSVAAVSVAIVAFGMFSILVPVLFAVVIGRTAHRREPSTATP